MRFRISPKAVAGKIGAAVLATSLCLTFTANMTFAGSIERISVDSGNIQFNTISPFHQTLSNNGRYVAFNASLTGEPYNYINIFLRDRATGTTELVSIGNNGNKNASTNIGTIDVSDNGRYVVFLSKGLDGSIGYIDAYVRDRATGTTELISINNDGSLGTANKSASGVSISGDGRYVAFVSNSEDLVSNDNNGMPDVFVRDRVNGTTQRISIASDGTQADGNSGDGYPGTNISADGRYIVFNSSANSLLENGSNDTLGLFIHDRVTGSTESLNIASQNSWFDLSSNGRYVAFSSAESDLVANDSNGQADIFVRDRVMNTTELASITHDGTQTNAISMYPSISADGRYVGFVSMASNLVAGGIPQGIATFVRDRVANTTEMIDDLHDGSIANSFSFNNSAISADGRYMTFTTSASNLTIGDTNNGIDVFLHDRISSQVCQ